MNKECRWKLANMILDKSRQMYKLVPDGELQGYFEKIGFEAVNEGWEVEDSISWKATPLGDGPRLLFKPAGDQLYFAITAPMLIRHVKVLKIDKEAAKKILVLGLP